MAMMEELRELQAASGAVFGDSEAGIPMPVSYGNDPGAIASAYQGVALCDRSDWGLIQVSGGDRLRFLHNQSTNEFQKLQPGQGCDTVFVTSTART
ncbi:MAG: folate-binding protein, partial [Chroococcales cyanobacterium]